MSFQHEPLRNQLYDIFRPLNINKDLRGTNVSILNGNLLVEPTFETMFPELFIY